MYVRQVLGGEDGEEFKEAQVLSYFAKKKKKNCSASLT
jgi:hypothetical protein